MKKRIAVVLFNLGGPDSLDAVQPFLFNLFFDPAIIRIFKPFRWLLALFISKKRAPFAKNIYKQLGGKSPILEFTRKQAKALQEKLELSGNFKVFIAMRHWHPMTEQTLIEVGFYNPDEVILLPLYPQFSSTTSGSSFKKWDQSAKKLSLEFVTKKICCYPKSQGWINAQIDLIKLELKKSDKKIPLRFLFSAHGLPEKIISQGDPYQSQVEQTVSQIVKTLDIQNLDWLICYQSRVGPLEWIKPSTESALQEAANDGVGVIIIPVAFVSEHSETLVELDIEYKTFASKIGITAYYRVPTVSDHPKFINCLSQMVINAVQRNDLALFNDNNNKRRCELKFTDCLQNFD